jgi:hypothetical protein
VNRAAISIGLLFGASMSMAIGLVNTIWAIGAPSGESRSAVPAIVFLAISVASVAGAAKLWGKWRAGLAVGLVFHALWDFYLGSQVTPDQQTKVGSGTYFTAAAVLLVVAATATWWHIRVSSRPA